MLVSRITFVDVGHVQMYKLARFVFFSETLYHLLAPDPFKNIVFFL